MPFGGHKSQRRKAAWTPAALGSSVLLWLRADVGVTLTSSRVTTWASPSGYGGSVTATGASATQPNLTTWTGGVGGSAVNFDGGDTLATAANILPTADGAGFTIFTVAKFTDTASRCVALTNGTSGGIAISQNVGGGGKLQRWKLGVSFDEDGNAGTAATSVLTIDQVGATPNSVMYVNGSLVSTTGANAGILTPAGKLYLGASATSNFMLGTLREFLVVSGRMASPDITSLLAYSLTQNGV